MTEMLSGKSAPVPVLFLDFDGTLAPIASHPDGVHLRSDELDLLDWVARMIPVFVISGRAYPDIERRVPILSLTGLSGDHGAVRRFRDRLHIHPEAERSKEALVAWSPTLVAVAERVKGAVTEVKEYSLSIHYRKVDPEKVTAVTEEVKRLFHDWSERERFKISPGKMVMEIRPSQGVTKEETVDFFMELLAKESGRLRESFIPVMIGDDTTDLAAVNFAAAVGGRGCWVGQPVSGLDPRAIHLSGPSEVWRLLARLRKLLEKKDDPLKAFDESVRGS